MRAKRSAFFMAILTSLILVSPAFAHHGFTVEFDPTKCFDMQGTLTAIDWQNPHAYVHIDVKEAGGKVGSWSFETISPNSLKRAGSTKEDFLEGLGKPVAFRACPSKAGGPKYKGEVELLEMTDGVPRVLGQNVENLNADQVRQHLPDMTQK